MSYAAENESPYPPEETSGSWLTIPSSPPEDLAAWEQCTQLRLSKVRELRAKLSRKSHSVDPASLGCLKHEHLLSAETKLKKRTKDLKQLVETAAKGLQDLDADVYDVNQSLQNVWRVCHELGIAQGIVNKRLELRSKRPAQELVQDHLQVALESEKIVLAETRARLEEMQDGLRSKLSDLKQTRSDVHHVQLSKVQADPSRAPRVQRLIGQLAEEARTSASVCSKTMEALVPLEARMQKASARTSGSIRKRIEEMKEIRAKIEQELASTRSSIAETTKELENQQKIIRFHTPAPDDEDGVELNPENARDEKRRNAAERAMTQQEPRKFPKSPAIQEVRSKIKDACFVCFAGARLGEVFRSFDTDRSGTIEEVELRMGLRRQLKINPVAMSDAEITLIFEAIDFDKSGAIALAEFTAFLAADCDVDALQAQCDDLQDALDQLRTAEIAMVADLRAKSTAAKIDEACLKVLGPHCLDSPPSRSPSARLGDGPPATLRKNAMHYPPLVPEALEALRAKVRAAACICTVGPYPEMIFTRANKDRSGSLVDEDVRRAFRQLLRLPVAAVSDAEIFSLAGMLDVDGLGTVSVSQLVEFVDMEPVAPQWQRCRSPSAGGAVSPQSSRGAAQARIISPLLPSPSSSHGLARVGRRSFAKKRRSSASMKDTAPDPGAQLEKMRAKIQSAILTGSHSRRVDLVLGRFSRAKSGLLEYGEVLKALRHGLKMTARSISDDDVLFMCIALDVPKVGSVSIEDFIAFINSEDVSGLRLDVPTRAHDQPHSAR